MTKSKKYRRLKIGNGDEEGVFLNMSFAISHLLGKRVRRIQEEIGKSQKKLGW